MRTKRGPAGRLHQLLSEKLQKKLADDQLVEWLRLFELSPRGLSNDKSQHAVLLRSELRSELDKLIERPDTFTAEERKFISMDRETEEFVALGDKRTAFQTARMNRALLGYAFLNVIKEMPERFRLVQVEVVSGADVVLVLSSCASCRWEVKLHPKAKVVGVILCGAGAHEVAGVDCPIVYRTYRDVNGKFLRDGISFHGCGELGSKTGDMVKLTEGIKAITGKDMLSFKGQHQPATEPITVRTGEK